MKSFVFRGVRKHACFLLCDNIMASAYSSYLSLKASMPTPYSYALRI